jgi:hypothetical protein
VVRGQQTRVDRRVDSGMQIADRKKYEMSMWQQTKRCRNVDSNFDKNRGWDAWRNECKEHLHVRKKEKK